MPHHKYLIVGGGMTADAAVRGIRAVDGDGSIGVVGEESHPPYDRPPLSKGLWKDTDEERIWRGTDSIDGVTLHLGRRILRLDRLARSATDDHGVVYTYEKLLLATGGRPRTLDDHPPQVIHFRTVDHYRRLRDLAESETSFAVIGGGFIGTEIAAALASKGKEVTLVFPEKGPLARLLPPAASDRLGEYFAEQGVEVRAETQVEAIRRGRDDLLVAIQRDDEHETLKVAGVVAGIGIEPNTELAEGAGLEVEDGIRVGRTLQTTDPSVFAAGDVASYPNPVTGEPTRIEHEDQANSSGEHAGRGMAGEVAPYEHIPLFYSDLFDLGFEAVGRVDSSLRTIEVWREPLREGAIFYLDGARRLVGAMHWGIWGQLDAIREKMRGCAPESEESLRDAVGL